jgi:hypothetical protein
MTYFLALLAGIAGAVAGFFLGAGIGTLLVPVFQISSFEGGAGYFAIAIGLLGSLICGIAGIVLTLRYRGGTRGFGRTLGKTALVIAALGMLVYAGIQLKLATSEHFGGGNINPTMEFEIRLPAGMDAPERRTIDFEMQAGSQRSGGQFHDDWMRREDNRVVLSGFVPLYTRTSSRILVVTMPGQPKLLFQIGLAATPKTSDTYGTWQAVNFVDDMKADSQPRKPNAPEALEIRYKVQDWTKP